MVGILIVTHRQLAEALVSASDLIMGRLEKVVRSIFGPQCHAR